MYRYIMRNKTVVSVNLLKIDGNTIRPYIKSMYVQKIRIISLFYMRSKNKRV